MKYEKELPEISGNADKLEQLLKQYEQIYQQLWKLHGDKLTLLELVELKELIEKIVDHIARAQPKVMKGVADMGGKVLRFQHNDIYDEGKAEGRIEGKAEGKAEGRSITLVSDIENLMSSLSTTAEKACTLLKVPFSDYLAAKQLIGK